MKDRIYPWLLGAIALTVYGGYFFFYFANLYATTSIDRAQGILPSMDWTSSGAFTFFLIAVCGFAVLCGLVIALVAALFFARMSATEKQPEEVAPLALTRAA